MTNGTIGKQAVLWSMFGSEAFGALFDLRWMLVLSAVLIIADFWWGLSESKCKGEEIRFSRALRRSCNKSIDYTTYLLIGCVVGLAIFEPLNICSHIVTSAVGIGLGCLIDLNSIVGHICVVKGLKFKLNLWTLLLNLLMWKKKEAADAIEKSKEEIKEG